MAQAEIIGRRKGTGPTGEIVWVRVPALHPHRILTLPGMMIPGEKGDKVEVEVRSEIEVLDSGYTALLVPVSR